MVGRTQLGWFLFVKLGAARALKFTIDLADSGFTRGAPPRRPNNHFI